MRIRFNDDKLVRYREKRQSCRTRPHKRKRAAVQKQASNVIASTHEDSSTTLLAIPTTSAAVSKSDGRRSNCESSDDEDHESCSEYDDIENDANESHVAGIELLSESSCSGLVD